MRKLIDGLRYFQDYVFWERQELFERSTKGQNPQALFITCSDSRVLPDYLMQSDPGDLFVARNAGNIVPPPNVPSGEAATIEYAIESLGVRDVIVCGHYRCGAVKALLQPPEGLPKVSSWLSHAAETRAALSRSFPDVSGDELWDRAVEQNVLVQVKNLEQHPSVASGMAEGTLKLHAWVLRFESGEVVSYQPATQSFLPLGAAEFASPREETIPESQEVPQSTSWLDVLRFDLLASFAVFAVALPLCVAIAKACGAPAASGIITAFVGGVIVGALGGGPLQVSGPTAGLIAIVLGATERVGLTGLAVVIVLAGLIQLAAAVLRMGQWFRAISPAVVVGMLAGIGIVLFSQQLHVTVDDAPSRDAFTNLLNMPNAFIGIFNSPEHPNHLPAGIIGSLTLAILLFWGAIVPKRLRSVPSVLVAIVIATAAAWAFGLSIQRVEFDSLASAIQPISPESIWQSLRDTSIWQLALSIALVASAETLLTAAAVDQMHNGPRTHLDRELAAQGVGNVFCGLVGALPMASVIVRSSANVQSGARSRWSTILHGVWMLAFVLLAPGLLRLIPTAALAAVLVMTGIKLIQFSTLRRIWEQSRVEAGIATATALAVVGFDLLTGVAVGLALSVVSLIHTFSRLRIRQIGDPASGSTTLILEGAATFVRLPKLAAALESVPRGATLHVDFKGLSYIDHASLELLMNWERQHSAASGQLVLDWDILRGRFQRAQPRPTVDRPEVRPA